MNGTFNKLRITLAAVGLICAWGMGFRAATARGAGKPGLTDHNQIAAIVAERDNARAAVADAQMRLRITRQVIHRCADELADADSVNEELRRELNSRPAGGRGLSAAGSAQ